ncbi:nitrate reductase gamma subunit [Gammaproteobacteria bacterium]
MWFLTAIYSVILYAAVVVFVLGVGRRIWIYASAPAPLKIPTTPAPTTSVGVAFRMFREVVFFESLFKSNKWVWLFGWLFHFGLLLVLLRHVRYFIEPVWLPVELVQPFGIYGAFAMLLGGVGLWMRRLLVERIRYISSPSDHLMLALLISIVVTGLVMKFALHTDVVGVKKFILGLMGFRWNLLPVDFVFILHLTLVALLMVIFPFSKLLHAAGVFFSPTRNQVDNPREKRHLASWARQFEQDKV